MATHPVTISVICAEPGSPVEFQRLVDSLRGQAGPSWELLVVGNSAHIPIEVSDDRLRVVTTGESSLSERRNIGLDSATGDFITVVNGGDVFGVGALERRVHAIRTGRVKAVYCPTEFISADLEILGFRQSSPGGLTFQDVFSDPVPLSSIIGTSDVMRKARFDPNHGMADEWAYITRLTRRGIQMVRVNDCEMLCSLGTRTQPPATLVDVARQRLNVLDLVYGPDEGCPDAMPEWRNGLAEPDQALIRTRLYAELITQLLLSDDSDALAAAMELLSRQPPTIGVDLLPTVQAAIAKQLVCPLADTWSRVGAFESQIESRISRSGLLARLPEFASDLARAGLPIRTSQSLIDPSPLSPDIDLPRVGEPVVGPFERGEARIREDELIYRLLNDTSQIPGRMIDVGAHTGRILSRFCADGWTVRAFEPDPVNRAGLMKRREEHWKLHIDPRAVSDRSGEIVQFYRTTESSGASSMTAFTNSHEIAGTVETVTLREALGSDWQGHIHLLKTDTEGHDLPVLIGFPWDRDHPDVVMCEFEDRKTQHLGYSTHDLGQFLSAQGYEVIVSEWHPVVRYGVVHDFKTMYRYAPQAVPSDAWGNLIAVRSSSAAKRLLRLAEGGVGLDQSPVTSGESIKDDAPAVDASVGKQGPIRQSAQTTRKALMPIAHWYATPSGLVFGLAAILLAIAFLGIGPWRLLGTLGVITLGVFIPLKFLAQYERARRSIDALSASLAEYRKSADVPAKAISSLPALETSIEALQAELRSLRIALALVITRKPEGEDDRARDPQYRR